MAASIDARLRPVAVRRRRTPIMLAIVVGLAGVGILASMTGRSEPPPQTDVQVPPEIQRTRVSYGESPEQFAEVWRPASDGPHPVVVLVHGGFWRARFELDLMDPLALDLATAGYAVWNLEYRRVGQAGGGVPGTLEDVDAALALLADLAADEGDDLGRVAIVGHSAGGHLALWAAGNGSHGVRFALAVGQAPVVRLAEGSTAGLGAGAIDNFLGVPATSAPDLTGLATPLPSGDPTLVVVGTDDAIVPPEFTTLDGAEVVTVEGADHFDLIDPSHEAWSVVRRALDAALN